MAKYALKDGCSIWLETKDNEGFGHRHDWTGGPVELNKAEAKHFFQYLDPYIPDDDEDEVETQPEDEAKPRTRRRRASEPETVSDPA